MEQERHELDMVIVWKDRAKGKATTSKANKSAATKGEPRELAEQAEEVQAVAQEGLQGQGQEGV